jgi:hypothetical protein
MKKIAFLSYKLNPKENDILTLGESWSVLGFLSGLCVKFKNHG